MSSVSGAYFIIGITGFCWALAQCKLPDSSELKLIPGAPYALLGELILLEGQQDRSNAPHLTRTRPSIDHPAESNRISFDEPPNPTAAASASASTTTRATPLHSRHGSRSSLPIDVLFKAEPSPLVPATERLSDENEVSLVLHHRPSLDDDPDHEYASATRSKSPLPRTAGDREDTADKAGVILGIHNVFCVLPQFIVTILSAVIFRIMEPDKVGDMPAHPGHAGGLPAGDAVGAVGAVGEVGGIDEVVRRSGGAVMGGSANAVGLIFL